MTTIKNVKELRDEIMLLEAESKKQEENMVRHINEIRERFWPLTIIRHALSSLTGVRLDRKNLISAVTSFFFRRLIVKVIKSMKNQLGNWITHRIEKVRSLFRQE